MSNLKKTPINMAKISFSTNQLQDLLLVSKSLFFLIMVLVMLLIAPTSYSRNFTVKNNGITLKQTTTQSLDSVRKRKIAQSSKKSDQTEKERVITNLNELNKLAEYPGGIEKFYAKIISNLDASELNYKVFTQINVSFIVEKDGSMSEIVVNSKIEPELKKEIIDGLKSIKAKWSPAKIDNQPVRIAYSLPIVLDLD
jgi:protein TonB